MPANKLYGVLNRIVKLEYVLSAPVEWRYVTMSDKRRAVLQPDKLTPGEWAAVEVLSIEIPGWTPEDWRRQFLGIERIFQDAGGVPHTGKYFGMGIGRTGIIQPFQDVGPEDVFSSAQKVEFRKYAESVDPHGLFRHGYVAEEIF